MYSHLIKTCEVIANIKDINDLVSYAVCGFKNRNYMIGGFDEADFKRDSCIEFDTKDFSFYAQI